MEEEAKEKADEEEQLRREAVRAERGQSLYMCVNEKKKEKKTSIWYRSDWLQSGGKKKSDWQRLKRRSGRKKKKSARKLKNAAELKR